MSTLDPTNESLYDRIDELRDEVAELRATIEAVRQAAHGLDASCTDEVLAALAAVPASPRRVETTADLDALPVGAHIRDEDGDYWDKLHSSGWWIQAAGVERSSDSVARYLPATVLWVPADGEVER